MKNLLLGLLTLISCSAFSQTIKYSDLNTGHRPKGTFKTYVDKNGDSYSVGDTLKIWKPSGVDGKFVYITRIDIIGDVTAAGPAASNTNAIIKKIRVEGTKRAGYKVFFQTKGSTAIDNYFFNIEDAIASKEIRSKGMTSDEALSELKKEKEKLDLGLISQEEYNKVKAKLIKYIK